MKFAEFLKENLVPEWRDKYLDYKGGKKKIKKITQSPLLSKTLADTITANTPGLPLPLPGSARFGDFSFRQRKQSPSNESFEQLPPAAITPELGPESVLHKRTPQNDRTPLLETDIGSYSAPMLREHTPSMPNLSQTTSTPATYGGGSTALLEGLPLENMTDDSATKEFVEWLDAELSMIESFYKEKEDHCLTRYLLLQDQMFHLTEEKMRMKSKNTKSDERLKNGLAKTTKGLTKLNKYELPSLPRGLFKRSRNGSGDHIDNDGSRDYEHHKHEVPYYVAKRQLKAAMQEFYRELELLKSYRMLNRTAFRKLVKKFDKRTNLSLSTTYMEKVNGSHFASSDVLDNLLPKVEDLYSANFENGNRKVAVEKLRSNLSEDHYYTPMFISGILYGLSIPLLAYALYLGLHKTITGDLPEGKYILQIWGGFFMLLLMCVLFGVNCFIWSKYKVNYRFIFEFNPKTSLDYREYPLIPSILLFFLALFSWFSFNDFWPEKLPARFWPWFFFGFALFTLLLPFDVIFFDSRKWLLTTTWRLALSGFYPVEFKDFALGDIFCSLTYTMGNISFFFCMYATHWSGALVGGDPVCGSSKSHLMGFFSTLPPVWRFLQCIRRYADSGDWFPHLANMIKYGITIVYYMTLSIYRIDSSLSHRAIFIFFAIVNSVFSSLWDIFMDFSLMQNKWLLRDDLVYPTWVYYFAMITDVILRFQWIFYALFTAQIQQSAVTSFCVGIAEVIRRFVWLTIRMENEHVTNTHLFRASREAPLPYETLMRDARARQIEEEEEEDEAVEDEEDITEITADDIESGRFSSIHSRISQPRKRRNTISNGNIFRLVTKAIVNAHAKDFQRRKSKPDEEAENSSDEDNSDDDHHI